MHFPDVEVSCDWSTFFPLKSADVSGQGTRQEPLRTSAWEAIKLLQSFDTVNTGLTRTDIYSEFFMNFILFAKLAKFSIVVRILLTWFCSYSLRDNNIFGSICIKCSKSVTTSSLFAQHQPIVDLILKISTMHSDFNGVLWICFEVSLIAHVKRTICNAS